MKEIGTFSWSVNLFRTRHDNRLSSAAGNVVEKAVIVAIAHKAHALKREVPPQTEESYKQFFVLQSRPWVAQCPLKAFQPSAAIAVCSSPLPAGEAADVTFPRLVHGLRHACTRALRMHTCAQTFHNWSASFFSLRNSSRSLDSLRVMSSSCTLKNVQTCKVQ